MNSFSSSCPTCALPNSEGHGNCAFCGAELLRAAPLLARMTRTADAFVLVSGERMLAYAQLADGTWKLAPQGGQTFTMVTLRREDDVEVVLLDASLSVVASFRQASDARSTATVVCDAADALVAVVRADGMGGLHAIDTKGNVLMFAGRSRTSEATLDLLLTDTGVATPIISLFALAVALEAEQLGPLHRRSSDHL